MPTLEERGKNSYDFLTTQIHLKKEVVLNIEKPEVSINQCNSINSKTIGFNIYDDRRYWRIYWIKCWLEHC